ncbi:MAG TPA: hypothetical protein VJ771_07055 [Candidatus Nitrosotalea sp.]|nr:hypothetical protein [Candidatus Nitrosotalea sp.]
MEQNKLAFMTCIEIVIMRRGNKNYHLVMAKLDSLYHCKILDCYEHPERLRTVLKDVYKEDYDSILDDIGLELDKLVDVEKEIEKFFKIMKN